MPQKANAGQGPEMEESVFKELVENANDLIQSVDAKGNLIYANKAWLKTLGYKKSEVKSLNLGKILRKDQLQHCMQVFKQVCGGKPASSVETVFVAKDGREIPVEGSASARFKNGKFVSTIGIFRDVSARKKAEEELREAKAGVEKQLVERTKELEKQKELAENLFEDAPEASVLIDPVTFHFLKVNKQAMKLLAYDKKKLLLSAFHVIFQEKDRVKVFQKLRQKIGKASIRFPDTRIVTANKKIVPVTLSMNVIKYGEESVLKVLFTDITELKKTEEALRKEKQSIERKVEERTAELSEALQNVNKFKMLADSSTDAITLVSQEGEFLYANSKALEMYRFSKPEQMEGKNAAFRYVAPINRKWFLEEVLPKARAKGWNGELFLRRTNGIDFPCQATYYPVKDDKGKLLYLVKIERDVTEEKIAEQKIKERDEMMKLQIKELMKGVGAIRKGDFNFKVKLIKKSEVVDLATAFNKMASDVNELMNVNMLKTRELDERHRVLQENLRRMKVMVEQLQTVDRMKNQFLATTSHELKTPITPLIGQLGLLKRGDFGKLNEKQLQSVEMLQRNIERLNKLITDILDISRIMRGKTKILKKPTNIGTLIDNTLEMLKTKALEKNVSISVKKGELPLVECDSDKITEVIINLVDNAIKFLPKNGKIWVNAARQGKNVLVSVKDNGVGISKENIPKLFKPFTQLAEVTTRKTKGTGLGLSICKHLVELHTGKIWVESKGLGKGTTFYFSLPIKSIAKKGGESIDG